MLKRLAQLELAVAFILLAATTFLVFIAAVMRFFGLPLIWSVDLAQLLFIWLCFVGAARAMREKGHLGVDILPVRLPHRQRLLLETLVTVLVIVFLTALAVEGARLTWLNRQRTYGDSGLSYAFVTLAVPAGCLMLSGALIANAIDAWRRRAEGRLIYSRTSDVPVVSQGEI